MTRNELEQALDRYGGDRSLWPADVRAAAERLIAEDSPAAALVALQERLDAAIAAAIERAPIDAAMMGRIAAGMHAHDVAIRPTRRFAAFVAAAMAAFLVSGYALGSAIPISQGEDAIAGVVFGDSTNTLTTSGSAL